MIRNIAIDQKDESIKTGLNLAVNWLLNSRIQDYFGNPEPESGFAGWYDLERKEYPFIYGEITGYGIETLLYLHDKEKKAVYLEKAVRAGNWLIKNMQYDGRDPKAKGAFLWKYFPDGSLDTFVYSFDTGMCVTALVDLFQATGDHKFLDSAIVAAEWLIDVMQNGDGGFEACYDLQNRSFVEGKWSRNPGSYHAKISIGLLKLYNITQTTKLLRSVNSLCNWVLKFQEPDGRFKTNEGFGDIYMHAHCYATEGLLYASKELGDKKLEETALRGAKWLIKAQNANGGISRWYFQTNEFSVDENTEALAQAIRLWLMTHLLDGSFFPESVEKGLSRLLSLQCLDTEDNRAQGGFHYAILDGKLVPHINCWATLFSIQALQMYLDWKAQKLSLDNSLAWLI